MLAQTTTDAGAGASLLLWYIVFYVVYSLAFYGIFKKAGQEAWAAFVPIYNIYVLMKVVGRPGWWLLLYFIPIVNIVILIIVMIDLAKSFGKGGGYAVGLIFLFWIFGMILGFGSASYMGPAAGGATAMAPPPPPPPAG
jgi:hypothetical protein